MRRVSVPYMNYENFTLPPPITGAVADSPNSHYSNSVFTSPATSPQHHRARYQSHTSNASYTEASTTSPVHAIGGSPQHCGGNRRGGNGGHRHAAAVAACSETNIFLRHLPATIDDVMLRTIFAQFGGITSASVMRNIHTGESLGTAFVRFERPVDAKAAFAHFKNTGRYITPEGVVEEKVRAGSTEASAGTSGRFSPGGRLTVQWARRQHDEAIVGEKRARVRKLFIRNIPVDVTEAQLREMFAAYGPIEHVTLHADTAANPTGACTLGKRAAAARKPAAAVATTTTATDTTTEAGSSTPDTTPAPAEHGSDEDVDDIQVSCRSSQDEEEGGEEKTGHEGGEPHSSASVTPAHDAVTTDERLIAFITFAEDGSAAAACDAVHHSMPFEHCNGVALMAKLAEDTKQRTARRSACVAIAGLRSASAAGTATAGMPAAVSPLAALPSAMGGGGHGPTYASGSRQSVPPPPMFSNVVASTATMLGATAPRSEGAEGGEVATLFTHSASNGGNGTGGYVTTSGSPLKTTPTVHVGVRRGSVPVASATLSPLLAACDAYQLQRSSQYHTAGQDMAICRPSASVHMVAGLGSQPSSPATGAQHRSSHGLTVIIPSALSATAGRPTIPVSSGVYAHHTPLSMPVPGAIAYPSSNSSAGSPLKSQNSPSIVATGSERASYGSAFSPSTSGSALLRPGVVSMNAPSAAAEVSAGASLHPPALATTSSTPTRTFRHNPYGCVLSQPTYSGQSSPSAAPYPRSPEITATAAAHSVQG